MLGSFEVPQVPQPCRVYIDFCMQKSVMKKYHVSSESRCSEKIYEDLYVGQF
jgi:hypothetical protein